MFHIVQKMFGKSFDEKKSQTLNSNMNIIVDNTQFSYIFMKHTGTGKLVKNGPPKMTQQLSKLEVSRKSLPPGSTPTGVKSFSKFDGW